VRRGLIVIAVVACLVCAAAAGAQGPIKTARSGAWHARLGPWTMPGKTPLVVTRSGQTVLRRGLSAWSQATGVEFHELNGDRSAPELLVRRWTGGVHCCFPVDVYVFPADGRPFRVAKSFENPGVELRRVGRKVLFVSGDNRFAYRFTSYADSSWPIRVYELVGARLVDVTRRHPQLVRRDARRHWRLYTEFVRIRRDARGVLAAWAADQCMLGRDTQVRRVLPWAAVRMKTDYAAGGPRGAAYVRALRAFLARTGYCPRTL
jgi:hypothetical protein